jgi:hypothetical protein
VSEQSTLEFVAKSFRSVWHLELLLLLHREPQQAWRREALASELRASLRLVNNGVAALAAIGFVAFDQDHACHFAAKSAELEALARDVVDLYNRKPRAVMRAIFAAEPNRIQSFADAFRLRKDP